MMHHVERIWRRCQNIVRVGMLAADSDETTSTAGLQLKKSAMELHSHDHVQHYGFASAPLAGASGVILSVAGNQANGIVIGTHDPRYRPVGLGAGDSVMHDTTQIIHMQNNAKISVSASTEIDFMIGGNLIMKINAAGVTVNGMVTSTGDQMAGGISQIHHVHPDVQNGSGDTGQPIG